MRNANKLVFFEITRVLVYKYGGYYYVSTIVCAKYNELLLVCGKYSTVLLVCTKYNAKITRVWKV